jgi:uncharacterized protein YjeT (DUF2065 family)
LIAELLSALCLVAVLEGLFLFASPDGWRKAAEQLRALDDRQLRMVGAAILSCGLVALLLVRQFL